MFKSIKTRMIVLIVVVMILLVGVSTLLTFNKSRTILQDTLFENALESAEQNAKIVDTWLQQKTLQVDNFSYIESVKTMDSDRFLPVLKDIHQQDKELESIFVAQPNGDMINTLGNEANLSEWDYFKETLKTGEQVISEPVKSFNTGRPVIIICSPIYREEQFVGVVGTVVALDILQARAERMHVSGEGNGFIISKDKMVLGHPNKDFLGNKKLFEDRKESYNQIIDNMLEGKSDIGFYHKDGTEYGIAYTQITSANWSIAIEAKKSKVLAPINSIRDSSLWTGLIAIIIGIIITYFIANYIADAVLKLKSIIERIAGGDLGHDVDEVLSLDREDEVGQLARSLDQMLSNLRKLVTKISNVSNQVAESSQELAASGDQVDDMAIQVSSAIEEIASKAEEQSAQIDETNSNVNTLADKIQQVSDSSEQIATGAEEVMTNISQGSQAVNTSINKVDSVKTNVSGVAQVIDNLADKSNQIGTIIEMIDNISQQTNLLALNAAIEASRAGQYGRGFSVVADEIRELAEESGQATQQISNLIQEIQGDINQAVQSMHTSLDVVGESSQSIAETGQIFDQIEQVSLNLVEQIKMVRANSAEMEGNSETVKHISDEIAVVSQEFASNSEEVAASTEEQTAAVREIIDASKQLSDMSDQLNNIVAQFKL